MVTRTYFPVEIAPLRFTRLDENSDSSEEIISDKKPDQTDYIVTIGISDGWKRNRKYCKLLEDSGIADYSVNELIQQFSSEISKKPESRDLPETKTFGYELMVNIISTERKNMIIDKFKEGCTMRSISSIFGLPQITWRKILLESKFKMKKKKVSETQNKLPYKIEQRDIDIVREYFEINVYKKMTLESIWTFLKEKKIGGTQLSKSGVRYLVTKILKYSYKRVHILPK